jgi:hypothetical protein
MYNGIEKKGNCQTFLQLYQEGQGAKEQGRLVHCDMHVVSVVAPRPDASLGHMPAQSPSEDAEADYA